MIPRLSYSCSFSARKFIMTQVSRGFVAFLRYHYDAGIGDNAYAPQPRYMRLCWKKQHNHQHVKPPPTHLIDLRSCWNIHTISMSNHHQCPCWWCGFSNTNTCIWVEMRMRCHLCPIISSYYPSHHDNYRQATATTTCARDFKLDICIFQCALSSSLFLISTG